MNTAIANPEGEAKYAKSEALAAEITELSAYIYAATSRLLTLIHEFDKNKYWELLGMASCAHWLNFKCGIGMHAAREKVRVANALAELPEMSTRLARGEISYSKVRAMTRIANEENQDYLLGIAKHGTAHQVEKLVSLYRGCKRRQENANANKAHENRELHCHYDTNGCLVIHGRVSAEQGALIMKALEKAMAGASPEVQTSHQEGPAGTQNREPFHAKRADALAEMAEIYLASDLTQTSTADRYQVVVHVSPETLIDAPVGASPEARAPNQKVPAGTPTNANDPILSHLEDGPAVPAGTARRIACDCSIVKLTEDKNGAPLSIGRKTRLIPPAIKRALRYRDKGCRFPGCGNTQFIDGHHIKHWANGGETSMANLASLCRHHHRLVHEGGFGCERLADGALVFRDPLGNVLADACSLPSIKNGPNPIKWIKAKSTNPDIDANTCVPITRAGEDIDWHLAVGHFFALEKSGQDQPIP